jgi:hypothetical protein
MNNIVFVFFLFGVVIMGLDSKILNVMQVGVYLVSKKQNNTLSNICYLFKDKYDNVFKYRKECSGFDGFDLMLAQYSISDPILTYKTSVILHNASMKFINDYLDAISNGNQLIIDYDNNETVTLV